MHMMRLEVMGLDFILLSTSIAVFAQGFSQGMSDEEIAFWSAVFTQLGDTLATIVAQKALAGEEK